MAETTIPTRLLPAVQYTTPTTGSTVSVGNGGNLTLILNPAGSLVALTVTLNASPSDGDVLALGSSQAVTTLTMNGGTIVGGLATLAIASFGKWVYNATSTTWYRIG